MPSRPRILLTTRLAPDLVERLGRHAAVIEGGAGAGNMSRAEALACLDGVAAVINQNELRIDAELLDHAPNLRIVANATAGFDNMDRGLMATRGVWGTNAPDAYSADTANHAIGLLLAVTRRTLEGDRYIRSGGWPKEGWAPGGRWDGLSLAGRCLGIVGYGGIGRQVARRAEAFGMVVRHHSRSGHGDPGWLPLDDLLRRSDVVSLHCPLTAETRHLIRSETIGLMRPGAILINVSRGGVVRTDDLLAALRDGRLGGAGLDVFEFEPDVPAELMAAPNVVLTPHLGGCTAAARRRAHETCVGNVLSVLDGQRPASPVAGPAMPG